MSRTQKRTASLVVLCIILGLGAARPLGFDAIPIETRLWILSMLAALFAMGWLSGARSQD
jgi:hypothetical protein